MNPYYEQMLNDIEDDENHKAKKQIRLINRVLAFNRMIRRQQLLLEPVVSPLHRLFIDSRLPDLREKSD